MTSLRHRWLAGAGPALSDPNYSFHTPVRLVRLSPFHRGRHGHSKGLSNWPRSPSAWLAEWGSLQPIDSHTDTHGGHSCICPTQDTGVASVLG